MNNLNYRIEIQKTLIQTLKDNIEFAMSRLENPRSRKSKWENAILANKEAIKSAEQVLSKLI